jgi:hypothetical protein
MFPHDTFVPQSLFRSFEETWRPSAYWKNWGRILVIDY